MKTRIFIVMMLITAIFVFDGCKKGENDPFISLSSRKSRLSGKWKLSNIETTETGTFKLGATTYSNTTTTTYTGTKKITSTISSSTGSKLDLDTSDYILTIEIEKNGTFNMTETKDKVSKVTAGFWYFAGKSKEMELKNKEAVVFTNMVESDNGVVTTYSGNTIDPDQLYVIDQLKKKEMIIIFDKSVTNPASNIFPEYLTEKMTGTWTFEKD